MTDIVKPISSENLDNVNEWLIPDVNAKNTVTATVARKKSTNTVKESGNNYEVVEDIPPEDNSDSHVTAQELEKITQDAQKDGYEKGHEEGYQEGYQKGENKGEEDAFNKNNELINNQVERLQMVIDTLLIPIAKEQKELESSLKAMISLLVQKITEQELKTDSSCIVQCVDKALDCIEKSRDKITLFINPQDDEVIKKHLSNSSWNVDYQIDETLIPGGCRVETETSNVDFSIEEQLDQILSQITHDGESDNDAT